MTAARGRYRDRSWAELKEADKVSPECWKSAGFRFQVPPISCVTLGKSLYLFWALVFSPIKWI